QPATVASGCLQVQQAGGQRGIVVQEEQAFLSNRRTAAGQLAALAEARQERRRGGLSGGAIAGAAGDREAARQGADRAPVRRDQEPSVDRRSGAAFLHREQRSA